MSIDSLIAKPEWNTVLTSSLRIAAILLIILLLWMISSYAIRLFKRRLGGKPSDIGIPTESMRRAETLSNLLNVAAKLILIALAIAMILGEFGFNIGPLLAGAGIVGLAVGFGAQNLVRDVISGFFIILEDQVRLGDVAIINGTGGAVEAINFRTIVLRDLSGVVHVFPNGTITTLANMTKGWSAYVLDIGVAYKEDIGKVIEVIKDVSRDLKQDQKYGRNMLDDEIEVFGVDQFADSAVVIKARIKTRPLTQWEIGREYRMRMKMAFDSHGIEIPFPHQSIYFGEASKAIAVQLENGNQ